MTNKGSIPGSCLVCGLNVPLCITFKALDADLAESDEEEASKGEGENEDGVAAVELGELSIKQGQSDEDEDDVGTEDLERGLAEGEKGFDEDEAFDGLAEPVEDDREGDQVDGAKRADLPLV